MKKALIQFAVLAAIGFGFFWFLTIPKTIHPSVEKTLGKAGDTVIGENLFWAGGCASCHAAKSAKGDDKLKLGGNHKLETPVGVFHVPNISPDKMHGIGSWSVADFANALLHGTSPDGKHYYPAFPYASYSRMSGSDVRNLWAFMQTLPPVDTENPPHELGFPFNISRGLGLWKLVYGNPTAVLSEVSTPSLQRGRFLVETMGHCGECHTPRTAFGFGGLATSSWLGGGPAPEGDGRIPNITPHKDGIGGWSKGDIINYLETGFTPEYDSVGGSMVSVQSNLSNLPKSDLEAIADYLKQVPPIAKIR